MTVHGKSLGLVVIFKPANHQPTPTQNNHALIIPQHPRFCGRVRDLHDSDLFIASVGLQFDGVKCGGSRHWSRDDTAMVGARLVSVHVDFDDMDTWGLHRQEISPGFSFSGCGIRPDTRIEHDSAHTHGTSSGRNHLGCKGQRATSDF